MKRPWGVSLLVGLLVLTAIFCFGAAVLVFVAVVQGEALPSVFGIPTIVVSFGILVVGVLVMTSAVGMWIGKAWGWWLGTFGYVTSMLSNGISLLTIVTMSAEIEANGGELGRLFVKHGTRALIAGLLVLYLFNDNTLAYFSLPRESKWKMFAIVGGIALVFVMTINAIYWSVLAAMADSES